MDFGGNDARMGGEVYAGLMRWLGDEPHSGGEIYLSVRRRLILYFDRKNVDFPEDLADETLARVARRLDEEGTIDGEPLRFCYITARFVFLEWIRESSRRSEAEPSTIEIAATDAADEAILRERRLECLEHCIASLDAAKRDLITHYYLGERRGKIDNRRELAARFGITANALMIRASRIRDALESCVRKCLERKK